MTGSFLDYSMPRAADFPAFVSELVEIPAKTNPLGIKAIGEAGTIAAPPTVVNAVIDALRELGVDHIDMPLTPARIWQAANSAKQAKKRASAVSAQISGAQVNKRPTEPVIREHKIPTPDCKPYIAVEGPDRNLWFCENGAAKIGCFDPDTGAFREFPFPDRASAPVGIAVGGDGNLWFTEKAGNRIGRITVAGEIAEFAMPSANAAPDGIALGPDGNVWFSASEGDKIARISPDGRDRRIRRRHYAGKQAAVPRRARGALWFSRAAGAGSGG